MNSFSQFVDKKTRKSKKHLKLIEKMLAQHGLTVKNHLEEGEEPFLFVVSPIRKVSFEGIRIYQTGESIAYRVQKEEKTHPYGRAYRLDIQEMYEDLMSEEEMDEKAAAKEVVQAVIKELQQFFEKSHEAERDLRMGDFDADGDPLGRVMVRSTGTDYANTVMNNNKTRF
jgi:uncharacterized membrane-anchored protein YjiN (DUF445 family)